MVRWPWKVIWIFTAFITFILGLTTLQGERLGTTAGPASFKRSSSSIVLTADGGTLIAANPDSNTITLVDTVTNAVIIEIPVGVDPRMMAVSESGDRAYTANRGSDSISVVDLALGETIAEIPVGDRPHGVLLSPGGERLYVAERGAKTLRILDTASFSTIALIDTEDRPSGLALSGDGNTLYITHFLSGQVSVIDLSTEQAYRPLVRKAAQDSPRGKSIETQPQSPSAVMDAPVTVIPLWPDSNLVNSIVLSPDGSLAYIPHTRSNTSNPFLTFDTTVFPLVSMIDLATNTHLVGSQLDLATLDPPGVGLPFDGATTPDGLELWVLNAASNDITILDLVNRQLAAHIEVGDNPRGIVISPDGSTAYVNNTLAGTVSVIDTGAYTVTQVITTTQIPLPPLLLQGKRLFHSSDDPRMSNAQWISCNTCHFEGEHDGRTWTFGFAGPRNTTSLLGMIETYPLRWSGEWDESADSEFANQKENFGSGLIEGELNCSLAPPDCVHQPPNQGRSYDLDALAAFIDSLLIPISPNHAQGEPLTLSETRGQAIFNDPAYGCIDCHPPPLYTDQQKHDVGTATLDERIGPEYDTPSLRGLYSSEPYFHDGSATSLLETLTFPSEGSEHDLSGLLTLEEMADLIAFLLALPYE